MGAPQGYVGYDEGGQLTEAVRCVLKSSLNVSVEHVLYILGAWALLLVAATTPAL